MEAAKLAKGMARSRRGRWAPPAVLAALILVFGLVVTSSAAGHPGSIRPGELSGVAALSATNAWSVGDYRPNPLDLGNFSPASAHRVGGKWTNVKAASPPSVVAVLSSVAAVSATNIWAVGQFNANDGNDRTLIEHWNGLVWALVPSPNPGTFGNALNGVDASGADTVWAVGYQDGPPKPLALRRTGATWSQVATPVPPGSRGAVLLAVSVRSASDVWAVGYRLSDDGTKTLIEHWDGHAWSIVPSADPSGSDNELAGVSALAADDVWTVGYATTPTGDRTLVEHWDGHTWSVVDSPNPGGQAALAAVSFSSPTDGWAVGSKGVSAVTTALALHWDGHTWSVKTTPNLSNKENQLLEVDARAPGDVYAVGYHDDGTGHRTLVMHWNGTAWSAQ
jgi:hypothetical protein